MGSSEWASALPAVRRIAEQAGALVLAGHRQGTAITKKGAIDLVTEYDLASEAFVREQLAREFPGLPVVGEEGSPRGERVEAPSGPAFFVDPIDGTTNFAHGHPFFAVSIGLCVDGAPQLGVVCAPALGVTWWGAAQHGASRSDAPCRVSTRALLGDALVATGFGYDVVGTTDDNTREFAAVQTRCRGMRRCGAASLDLCLVADGTYDAYWEYLLQPWDTAAGAAIVLAAGGRVSHALGEPFELASGAVLASNGLVHDALSSLLREVRGGRAVPGR
jgi:myo-inositol-1(or 4)-monophosphatase